MSNPMQQFGQIRSGHHVRGIAIALTAALASTASAQPVIYVDVDAAGANNGTSWTDAYTDLQNGLAFANNPANGVTDVWIALGTYTPASPGGSIASAFVITRSYTIYGGFQGVETDVNQRLADYTTILSGDLNGDDGMGFGSNRLDNSTNVVRIQSASPTLDGIECTRSQGICVDATPSASLTMRNCTVSYSAGTGIRVTNGGGVILEDCIVHENLSLGCEQGNVNGAPYIKRCHFEGNGDTALAIGNDVNFSLEDSTFFANGAGVLVPNGAILRCRFLSNMGTSVRIGRGIVKGCLFAHNELAVDAYSCFSCGTSGQANPNTEVSFSTFTENVTGLRIWVSNCTSGQNHTKCCIYNVFWDNGIDVDVETGFNLCNLCPLTAAVARNLNGSGCCNGLNFTGDPLFMDPLGADLIPGTLDDDYRVMAGSPAIDGAITPVCCSAVTLPTDLNGEDRPLGALADLGAYEFTPTPQITVHEWDRQSSFGFFTSGSSWSGGAAPGESGNAVFDSGHPMIPGFYTVAFPDMTSLTNNRLIVQSVRTIFFQLSDGDYTLQGIDDSEATPSLVVGTDQDGITDVSINNGGVAVAGVRAQRVTLGLDAPSRGFLTVENSATFLEAARDVTIGESGEGRLTLQSGAEGSTTGDVAIGTESGSSGLLRLTGSGSTFGHEGLSAAARSELTVGGFGQGELRVENGATLTGTVFGGDVLIAREAASLGDVLITGADSSWTSSAPAFIVGDEGTASLSITSGGVLETTTFMGEVTLARQPGSTADVLISGPDSSWTEHIATLIYPGMGAATIRLEDGGSLNFSNVAIAPGGVLEGAGAVPGDLFNAGELTLSPSLMMRGAQAGAVISIGGDYRQIGLSPAAGLLESGTLHMTLAGDQPGEFDVLDVGGSVELGGGLEVQFADGFTPDPDTLGGISFLTAGSNPMDSRFDVAFMPGLPPGNDGGGRFLKVDYPVAAGRGGSVSVNLVVDTLTGEITVDPEQNFSVAGGPSAAAVADFGSFSSMPGAPDGIIDLAVAIPDEDNPTTAPGEVIVLFNAGNDVGGNWLGFSGNSNITVGIDPSALAAGDADNDKWDDLVVANRASNTFIMLRNTGMGSFNPDPPVATGNAPSAVDMGELDGANGIDIAVANEGDDDIRVYINQGGVGAGWNGVVAQPADLPTGDAPVDLVIANADNDKWDDIIGLNRVDGSLSIFENGMAAAFSPAITVPVGSGPTQVIARDLNGDALVELVTTDAGGDTVSVVRNTGSFTFAPSVQLPVPGGPRSIAAVDLDEDGDRDLAIIADDGSGTNNVVKVLRNDFTPASGMIFAPDANLPSGPNPQLVTSGDVDDDGSDDVLTINAGSGTLAPANGPAFVSIDRSRIFGATEGQIEAMQRGMMPMDNISVLVNAPQPVPPCPGDADGNFVVDVNDITYIIPRLGMPGPDGDVDGNGVVDVNDITFVIPLLGTSCL